MTGAAERIEGAANRLGDTFRGIGAAALQGATNPEFVVRLREVATPAGQWIAALTLIVIVPLTFTFTVIWHRLLISIVLRAIFRGAESAAFLVTLMTLVFFIIACWLWFQWVRTAGFGLLNMGLGGNE